MIRTVTRNDWDLGPVEDTQVVCSACESLGRLCTGRVGRLVHFRCDCGAEYSHDHEEVFGEDEDLPMDAQLRYDQDAQLEIDRYH